MKPGELYVVVFVSAKIYVNDVHDDIREHGRVNKGDLVVILEERNETPFIRCLTTRGTGFIAYVALGAA
jgi:hypothetical protein